MVEQMLEDRSTRDVFLFRLACHACGTEYANKPVPFSKAAEIADSPIKKAMIGAIYEKEYRFAQHRAIRNAAEHMNLCPICKRLVCNKCFMICEELDMCRDCAAALEQKGSPVEPESIERDISHTRRNPHDE
jgi:rRNA maturation endonuclease Nob1